jgi:hypothetical protein
MLMTVGLMMSGKPTNVRIFLVDFRQVRIWCRVGAVRHGMRWGGGDRFDGVGGFREGWGVVGSVGSGGGSGCWVWDDVDDVEGSHS